MPSPLPVHHGRFSGFCYHCLTYDVGPISVYDILWGIPVLIFFLFLVYKSLRMYKLHQILNKTESTIYTSYFVFIWCVGLFNVFLAVAQGSYAKHFYDAIWFASRFMSSLLEMVVVAFLFLTSAATRKIGTRLRLDTMRELFLRSALVGLVVATVDTGLQIFLTVHYDIKFVAEDVYSDRKSALFWICDSLFYVSIYLLFFGIMRYSYWWGHGEGAALDLTYIRYMAFMAILHTFDLTTFVLLYLRHDAAFCLLAIGLFAYTTAFGPVLYRTLCSQFIDYEGHWPLLDPNRHDDDQKCWRLCRTKCCLYKTEETEAKSDQANKRAQTPTAASRRTPKHQTARPETSIMDEPEPPMLRPSAVSSSLYSGSDYSQGHGGYGSFG